MVNGDNFVLSLLFAEESKIHCEQPRFGGEIFSIDDSNESSGFVKRLITFYAVALK